ncbi:MAG: ATP-binding protein [Acidimicrobiia bacterium]|nr:ATP-binding protein [Acidimicrobiia bacterium]MYC57528.1 ATP-binding protein [Acidimicrobiia bacterium]MYI30108.1 ATP-binding protein [Acidimicrobiia bacterium]
MDDYRYRLVDPLISGLLAEVPAIFLVGPRASGKTTTALRYAATAIRLDRAIEAAAFEADPDAALRGLAEPVLLDEWQAVPGVLGAVKRAVDSESYPGRFIITGSARASLDESTWAGTGRLVWVDMHPLSVSEMAENPSRPLLDRIAAGDNLNPTSDTPDLRGYIALALRGGFPEVALGTAQLQRRRWLRSYIRQVVERDTLGMAPQRDPQRLSRYFEAYALNSAGVVEDKAIYTAAGVNRETGNAYRQLLSNLRIIDELPSWHSNRLSRLVKSPKRYLIDPALLSAVVGATEETLIRDSDLLGRFIETFVVAQLRSEAAVSDLFPQLYHLRDAQGRHEIDVIAEFDGQQVVALEIKSSGAPTNNHARHLRWLRDRLGDRFVAGVVLHTGPQSYELGERISAVPVSALWAG